MIVRIAPSQERTRSNSSVGTTSFFKVSKMEMRVEGDSFSATAFCRALRRVSSSRLSMMTDIRARRGEKVRGCV
jgi:hypothetical protein